MAELRRFRLPALAIVLAAGIGAGCATRSINHVLADPYRYADRQVTLSGYVADSYSIGRHGFYRLEDRTGALWVVSDRGVPRRGARVRVRGIVRDGFNLGAVGDRLPRGVASGLVLVARSQRPD